MINGYYVSMYCDISHLGNLYCLGFRHDNCIALWKKDGENVELVHYWELERLTGIKQQMISFFDIYHCYGFLNRLLAFYSLTVEDIEEIWGIPQINDDDRYLSKYKYPDYSYHTMCHLASCLFMNMDIYKNENILAFSLDGGSDTIVDEYDRAGKGEDFKFQFTACYSDKYSNKLQLIPVNTPSLMWGYLAVYFNLREGSLMALASASTSRAYIEFENINVRSLEDYDECVSRLKEIVDTVESFTDVDIGVKFNGYDKNFNEQDNKISMVMKIIQEMSYNIMDENIKQAFKDFNIKPEDTYLSMSGGFALNCPCNTYLMKKYKFKGFIAPPCVSDSGMAMGIGLYSFYQGTDGNFKFKLNNAYYGDFDNGEQCFDEYKDFIESIEEFDSAKAAKDIEKEPIIWFDGRAEMGPRALGARSLLADPRKSEAKDRLNEIKQRQWWRPVAPIMKRNNLKEWFEEDFDSPFMLHAFKIKEEKKELVPGIVHLDGSARVQSIDKDNSRLYNVLEDFEKSTGIPIICNTSLNDKGEPIINTVEEAFNFALRKGIKTGYFNGKRIIFRNHEKYNIEKPLERGMRIAVWKNQEERDLLVKKNNPYSVSHEVIAMQFYYLNDGKDYFSEKNSMGIVKRNTVYIKMLFAQKNFIIKEGFRFHYGNSIKALKKYIINY